MERSNLSTSSAWDEWRAARNAAPRADDLVSINRVICLTFLVVRASAKPELWGEVEDVEEVKDVICDYCLTGDERDVKDVKEVK